MFNCPNCKKNVEDYESKCSLCGQDLSKGQWAYKNAPLGNSEAQFWLGLAYKFGVYVEQDAAKYHDWTLQAARNGNSKAMAEIGTLYISLYFNNTNGDVKFYEDGLYWLIKARDRGETIAINNLDQLGIINAHFLGSDDTHSLVHIEMRE